MEFFHNLSAIFTSGNFKIAVGVFLFILVAGFIVTSKSDTKKASKLINRLDRYRNFDEEDDVLNEDDNSKYNELVKPYLRKNKDLYEKLLGVFGINLDDISKKLTRANITKLNAEQVSIIKIGGVFLSIFVGFTLFLFLGVMGLGAGFLIAAGTLFLPDILIEEQYQIRKKEILHVLPNTLRLMSDATSTGHTINNAIMKVSKKYKNLLSKEFDKAQRETEFTNDWTLALENMAVRCDIDEIHNLVEEIKITTEKGTSITDTLINFAEKLDAERAIRLTEVARKKNTTLLLPILLFLFAPLIGLILLPAFDLVMNAL